MTDIELWALIFTVLTFSLYIGIAIRTRVKDTEGFYVAGHGVPAVANGAAIAADWMSAASFISMAGLISFLGFDGAIYLLGWTGGYVLLALLLAPYLRKFGKYTVPDFVGDRYSESARAVSVVAAVFVSFTYVAGQMAGVGIVFARFIGVTITTGVIIGMCVVFIYAVLGGMKGITWTQVAQYSVLIIAYLIPAWAIAGQVGNIPVPQISFGEIATTLNQLQVDFGLSSYTEPFTNRPMQDVFFVALALMIGTAGLPHIIVRFYTTPSVRAARYSAGWALLFIALLYTTAPAVAVFAKTNLLQDVANQPYSERPDWVRNWEATGLIAFDDRIAFRLPAGARPAHLHALLLALDRMRPGARSDVGRPLHQLADALMKRSLVVLISDLLDDPGPVIKGLKHLKFRGSDVIVFQVLDPNELTFPFQGPSKFRDLESAEEVTAEPSSIRTAYLGELAGLTSRYERELRGTGIDYVQLDTSRPLDFALLAYLSARSRRQ